MCCPSKDENKFWAIVHSKFTFLALEEARYLSVDRTNLYFEPSPIISSNSSSSDSKDQQR